MKNAWTFNRVFFSFIDIRGKSCCHIFFFALVTKNKQSVSILVFLILSRTACQKTGALMGALLQTTDVDIFLVNSRYITQLQNEESKIR